MATVPGPPAVVLLVEDDPGDALLTREMLDGSGFSFMIEPANRLADAVVRLRQGVDCVLLDLGLPDAGGLEALDQIVAAAPRTPVIVLTGRADRDLALAAMARGAQDYLQKGELDGELLSRSVRYAIERKRSEEAARRLLANELLAAESGRLERGLLARPMLRQAGLRSASRYRSGGGSLLLGGDFYDAIELEDGRVRVVIGDVSGHGPDEAAMGVALRIAWRGLVLAGLDEDAILANMQSLLVAERLHDALFATVCDATISVDRSTLTLRTAGHPPPILSGPTARWWTSWRWTPGYLLAFSTRPRGRASISSCPSPGCWFSTPTASSKDARRTTPAYAWGWTGCWPGWAVRPGRRASWAHWPMSSWPSPRAKMAARWPTTLPCCWSPRWSSEEPLSDGRVSP